MTGLVRSGSATILDVAELAGVSRTTVSRVLNEPERVPDATVQRVLTAMEELEYRPNDRARSLRTGKSKLIALLVGDVSQPFHAALSKAVSQEAEARGLSVVLCDLDHNPDRLVDLLERLAQQGVDGVIIATDDDLSAPAFAEAIDRTVARGLPVVLSGRTPDAHRGGVGIDFAEIAGAAAALVLEVGRRAPVLLVGSERGFLGRQYVAGYTSALAGAGIDGVILEGQYSREHSLELVSDLLRSGRRPDAIITASIGMALGAVQALERAGLAYPAEVSVVACEESPLADALVPTVTTVGVPPESNGAALVETLSALIDGAAAPAISLNPQVTRRESC